MMEDSRDHEDIEIDICDRDSDTESRKDGDDHSRPDTPEMYRHPLHRSHMRRSPSPPRRDRVRHHRGDRSPSPRSPSPRPVTTSSSKPKLSFGISTILEEGSSSRAPKDLSSPVIKPHNSEQVGC